MSIRPPILDGDCLPFDVACIFQALTECGHIALVWLGLSSMDKPNYWNWLLSARRKRPDSRRTANQCDELAALHVPPDSWIVQFSKDYHFAICAE
jgi:hypothetical protein